MNLSRSYPLTAVEDPPSQRYQRYGFCPVPAGAQLLGLTVLAPVQYDELHEELPLDGTGPSSPRVHRGEPLQVPPEPVGEVRRTQLFEELRGEHQEVPAFFWGGEGGGWGAVGCWAPVIGGRGGWVGFIGC
eukprot:Skav200779  [mRNA]  locus=scaffold2001:547883:549899:+ [translate_table: standard]